MFKVVRDSRASEALHYVLAYHVYESLQACGGSVKGASVKLGCGPGKVDRCIINYGMHFDEDRQIKWPYEKRLELANNKYSAKPRGRGAKTKPDM